MSNRTLRNSVHIDPRRPWLRGRKFGWDALPDVSTSILPDLAPCEGAPVGSGGVDRRRGGAEEPAQLFPGELAPVDDANNCWGNNRPTALPSVLGQEAINIVFALCLAAGTLVSAAIANEPVEYVKVYTERME